MQAEDDRTAQKIRVSPAAFQDASRLYSVNGMSFGPRPSGVQAASIEELLKCGVLAREGIGRGVKYALRVGLRAIEIDLDKGEPQR